MTYFIPVRDSLNCQLLVSTVAIEQRNKNSVAIYKKKRKRGGIHIRNTSKIANKHLCLKMYCLTVHIDDWGGGMAPVAFPMIGTTFEPGGRPFISVKPLLLLLRTVSSSAYVHSLGL